MAEVRRTPKFGRMFGSATCEYSAELRKKIWRHLCGVLCRRSRSLEVTVLQTVV